MGKMLRADLGTLQEQEPERSEKDEEKMTFDEFLNRCFDNFEELAELDENLPFED